MLGFRRKRVPGLGRADALKRLAKLGLDASWQWKNTQAGFTPDEGLRPEQLTCEMTADPRAPVTGPAMAKLLEGHSGDLSTAGAADGASLPYATEFHRLPKRVGDQRAQRLGQRRI